MKKFLKVENVIGLVDIARIELATTGSIDRRSTD